MIDGLNFWDSVEGFWLLAYSIAVTLVSFVAIGSLVAKLRRNPRMTWELHSEYIDVSEFSNRNIPLRVNYKGTEPPWLWATYFSVRNTGVVPILQSDCPERQQLIVGAPGCRYIGFNKLISDKAKVTLSPLFKGEDVYCKVEFDKLGPGDEILASLLFIANEKKRVFVEGSLFGSGSRLISGYSQRIQSWRLLWWLLLGIGILGLLGGFLFWQQTVEQRGAVMLQLQYLAILYFLAIMTAGILLRPIRYWEQIPDKFHGRQQLASSLVDKVKFFLGMTDNW